MTTLNSNLATTDVVDENDRAGFNSLEDQPALIVHLVDTSIQETTMPKASNNRSDIQAISSLLQTYAEGGRRGDAAFMKRAFRDDATIHGFIAGSLLAGPIQMLFDWVADNAPASDLQANIVDIDVANSVATARVEIKGWFEFRFTDQFTLLKEGDSWTITSKVFHTH